MSRTLLSFLDMSRTCPVPFHPWTCPVPMTTLGTGIIMTKNLAKYVQRYQGFDGRVMYVNMYMRGNIKLRVIQVYSYASHTNVTKQAIIKLNNYVKSIINEAHQKNFYFI